MGCAEFLQPYLEYVRTSTPTHLHQVGFYAVTTNGENVRDSDLDSACSYIEGTFKFQDAAILVGGGGEPIFFSTPVSDSDDQSKAKRLFASRKTSVGQLFDKDNADFVSLSIGCFSFQVTFEWRQSRIVRFTGQCEHNVMYGFSETEVDRTMFAITLHKFQTEIPM
jgi:hypothetical protein